MRSAGIHHITAIAGDPQRNLDFYTQALGLRLVKRTVNFDDPGSYHFYFGDNIGSPGTIMTFFPWPGARRGARGSGQVTTVSFAVPRNSMAFWKERLRATHVIAEEIDRVSSEDGFGQIAVGTVHHIAFRAADDDEQLRVREQLVARGLNVTPVIDRQYFHSIYFREPNGILFEIATDGPGFLIDEPADALGETLKLPSVYEPKRDEIERVLPTIHLRHSAA